MNTMENEHWKEIINSNKIGKVQIYRDMLLLYYPDVVANILSKLLIVEAKFSYDEICFEYVAFCADFDSCYDGIIPPYYSVNITTREGKSDAIKFVKA